MKEHSEPSKEEIIGTFHYDMKNQKETYTPIEQKADYKVERQRFIDDYANNRERENMRDSLGRIFDMWIIPLACRIKELGSQSLPIEGGEREWIHIDDVIGFAGFMREAECTCTPEWYKQQLSEWLAFRNGLKIKHNG